jgi:hypothetical protein
LKSHMMVFLLYPRAVRQFANCLAIITKSVTNVPCFQYHCRLQKISLFRTLSGCTEAGGMYM